MTELLHDTILWTRYKNGDQDAFGQLFRRYYPELFQYGMKLKNQPALLEDTIQELFVELWLNKQPIEVQSVKAYLLKSLRYKLLRAIHRNKLTTLTDDPDEVFFEISHESFLIINEQYKEKAEKILVALQQLSSRQQEIVYLKFYKDLDYNEISDVMQINYQAARNLLYQSIKSLKKVL